MKFCWRIAQRSLNNTDVSGCKDHRTAILLGRVKKDVEGEEEEGDEEEDEKFMIVVYVRKAFQLPTSQHAYVTVNKCWEGSTSRFLSPAPREGISVFTRTGIAGKENLAVSRESGKSIVKDAKERSSGKIMRFSYKYVRKILINRI